MAHLENGFARIANDTLRALARTILSTNERRILDIVFWRTYGAKGSPIWARISMRFYAEATGMDFRTCALVEKRLRDRNIIIRDGGRVRFQKYSDKWKSVGGHTDRLSRLEKLRGRNQSGSKKNVGGHTDSEKVNPPDHSENGENVGGHTDAKNGGERKTGLSGGIPTHSSGGTPTKKENTYKNKKTKKKRRPSKKKVFIKPHLGEFENVQLTKSEYQKLIDRFGEAIALQWIENASTYFEQIGSRKTAAKYKSHYACILNWSRMEQKRLETSGSPAARKKREDQALRNWYRRNVKSEGKP